MKKLIATTIILVSSIAGIALAQMSAYTGNGKDITITNKASHTIINMTLNQIISNQIASDDATRLQWTMMRTLAESAIGVYEDSNQNKVK